jgi:hypothetical protein
LTKAKKTFLALLALLCFSQAALGAPTTQEQAAAAVRGWLALNAAPFGETPAFFSRIESFGERGAVASSAAAFHYIAYLEPRGIVIIPADDLLEPITAYFPEAKTYEQTPANPIYKMVTSDLKKRVKALHNEDWQSRGLSVAQERWRLFAEAESRGGSVLPEEIPSVDVKVAPLLKTRWGQEGVENDPAFYVFNYYTPERCPAGTVATATSQIMKNQAYPRMGVGVKEFGVLVGESGVTALTRGGDGDGGRYSWELMPDVPDERMNENQRRAIGALLFDAGIAAGTAYGKEREDADLNAAARALVETFGYSNAVAQSRPGGLPLKLLVNAINSNLDAGLPVILGIEREDGNYAAVSDGYAYDGDVMYYHVNIGSNGESSLWLATPEVSADAQIFDSVSQIAYNIFTEGGGEVISGRVITSGDKPIEGALVSIKRQDYAQETKTDSGGNFAFKNVPSDSTLRVEAQKEGLTLQGIDVVTKKSASVGAGKEIPETGNIWNVTITEQHVPKNAVRSGSGGCVVAALPMLILFTGLYTALRRKNKIAKI